MYSGVVNISWTNWLEALMKEKQLNNKGLAALLKISPSTVGNWLAGAKPETDSILRLAELAGEVPARVFNIANGLVADDKKGRLSPYEQKVEALIDKLVKLAPEDQDEIDAIVEVKLSRRRKG